MNNYVILYFDKMLTNLAGYQFGENTYETQVKGKLDLSKPFTIEFPKEICGVASSFVQGLFSEIVDTIGLRSTENLATIKSENSGFDRLVMSKLQ